MWSHTLSSLTTSIPYFVNEIYMFSQSTWVIASLDKVIPIFGGVKTSTKVAIPPKVMKPPNHHSSPTMHAYRNI